MSLKSLLFVMAVVWCVISHAQPYYFRHYQVENGLSNNAVICSVQDKQGFLWFGTKDGLNRYDGYTFKIFRNNPDRPGSLGSNFVHSLYEDKNGVLWVGTENGLYRYNATTETFSLLHPSESDRIRDIKMDKQNNLWFIGGFTLYQFNTSQKKLLVFPPSQFFEATSMDVASNGALWVSTPTGQLKKYHPVAQSFESIDVFQHSPVPVSKWIEKIYADNKGNILIGTSTQGMKVFSTTTNTYKDVLTYNNDKTEIFVRNFIQTSEHEFWIASETGIYIYNTATETWTNLRKQFNDLYSISDNAVYTFCKDKEGGIWSGTYFGGINYFPKPFTFFKKAYPKIGENSLTGNVVREIKQDEYGNLWIGTEDAGLNKLDINTEKFISFQPTGKRGDISYTNIHGLLVDGKELWVGTFEHGLDVLDIKTGKVVRHYTAGNGKDDLISNFIYCIYRSQQGEIMLGTTRGAYFYNREKDLLQLLPGLPVQNWYSSLLKDSEGVIWAGTYGAGLNYLDTKTGKVGNFRYNASHKNSLSSNRINSIFEDSKKNLWIATEGGLCLYDRKTKSFNRYTTANGFPSDFILSILEDGNNKLWISTSKGLVRFDPSTSQTNVYTRVNGLLSDQFNFSSAFKDRTGRMYFGSVKGMISFHPDEFQKNTIIPPVYVTGFQVNNNELLINGDGSPLKKSLVFTDRITLNHDQSTFSIDFAAPSFTAPQMLKYAYKMEGLTDNWTYLKGNRKVYFTELSPGTYVFKVKAANSSGIWNEEETKLMIEILPPWWASWLAYTCYIFIAAMLLAYAIRNYHNRIAEKNRRKIELLEIAKEKEIFEAKIEFFTNVAHEIKTPLTLIKGPLDRAIRKSAAVPDVSDSLKMVEKNTNRLLELTSQLLDFRQTEIKGFSLNYVKANIPEVIADLFTSFKPLAEQKNLHYKLKLTTISLYAYIDTDAFNKILSNLLSNAIKYSGSKVDISLHLPTDNNMFEIRVCNDGYLIPFEMKEKIFEPFFRLKGTEKQKGTGIGLALARSLAQLHNGSLQLVESNNSFNTFSLLIPIHQQIEFEFNFENKKESSELKIN